MRDTSFLSESHLGLISSNDVIVARRADTHIMIFSIMSQNRDLTSCFREDATLLDG